MFCWVSDGAGTFQIQEVSEENESFDRGTKIVIHLKPEYLNYLDENIIKNIIQKYQNFIQHDIYLNNDKLEIKQALWY